jgi:hypothetical protein
VPLYRQLFNHEGCDKQIGGGMDDLSIDLIEPVSEPPYSFISYFWQFEEVRRGKRE